MKKYILGKVCEKIGSGATPRGGSDVYLSQGEFSLIRSQNVYNDGFKPDGLAFITKKHAEELNNVEVKQNDILLNITGDSVARCCQVPAEFLPARVNQHVAIIRPDSNLIDSRFLRYFLINTTTQEYLLTIAGGGATRNALTKGMLESLEILAPPINEQHVIAEILSAFDNKIELNFQINQTLEKLCQTIFSHFFVDNTDTNKWIPINLSEICSTQYGFTASTLKEKEGPRFLRITDMNKDPWITWQQVPFCKISENEFQKYKLEIGDILVSRMADPGKAAIMESNIDSVFASYLVRLKMNNPHYAYFAYYFLRSSKYLEYSNGAKSGSVQLGMNAKVITAVNLKLPPEELAIEFENQILPFREKINSNLDENSTLVELRDTLLPKLMSGKLKVNYGNKE
jgi:type I restriction enzyme S subunit